MFNVIIIANIYRYQTPGEDGLHLSEARPRRHELPELRADGLHIYVCRCIYIYIYICYLHVEQ